MSKATTGHPPASEPFAGNASAASSEGADHPSMESVPAVRQTPPEDLRVEKAIDTENAANYQSKKWDYDGKGGADFNMEAPILAEDVVRAGGLGARDDLDSFLPSAVDATDYEESLNDAMQYEDVQPVAEGEIARPGVGFVKAQHQEMDGFRDK